MPEEFKEWEYEQARRLRNGDYLQVPWLNETWWIRARETWGRQYPHMSKSDPQLLAYTENNDKGERDIQTQIRPGRYLTKFFPDLSQEEKEEACSQWKRTVDPDALKIATDPDTIQWVYENGPPSCMSKSADDFPATDYTHPVRAYGNSDLAVAYVLGQAGLPVARAVVYPELMEHAIIYGEMAFIQPLLQAAGWKPARHNWNGAKLRHLTTSSGETICPYLDIGSSVEADGAGNLVICDYGESYTVFGVIGNLCERCEDCHAEHTVEVRGYAESLCEECYIDCVTECEGCGEDTYNDDIQYTDDGMYRCADCVEEIRCDECGGFLVVADPETYIPDCCGEGYFCGECHDEEACLNPEPENEDLISEEVAIG